MSVKQLLDLYIRHSRLQGKSQQTITWYERRWGQFVRYLERAGHSLNARDLTPGDGERYIEHLMQQDVKWAEHPNQKPRPGEKLSPFTIHGHVRALRAVTRWAADEQYLLSDPFARLPLPKLPKHLVDVLEEEEIQRILECADSDSALGLQLRAMILLAVETGIRAGELIGLKLDNVDFEAGTIRVIGKGNKERLIPIGAATQKELMTYIEFHRLKPTNPNTTAVFLTADGNEFSYSALNGIVQRLKRRAGIRRVHMHLFRHT